MTPDFALHITWTCYGTWLPGDDRGHVSNVRNPDRGYSPRRNTPGTPYAAGDPWTLTRARSLQKQSTVWLDAGQADRVAETLVTVAKSRGWFIPRAAVMANHVHVVVFDCPADGPAVRRVLKGTTQAALTDLADQPRTWWTTGGSDRYKNDPTAVAAAINYVARQTGKLAEVIDMVAYRVVSWGGPPWG
jgi:REP element-mobilizing transposase RayT